MKTKSGDGGGGRERVSFDRNCFDFWLMLSAWSRYPAQTHAHINRVYTKCVRTCFACDTNENKMIISFSAM